LEIGVFLISRSAERIASRRHGVPSIVALRRPHRRGQTVAEVLMAIAVLSVVVVFITADLMNLARSDSATDRTLEISSANYFLGVMKSDPGFWSTDWSGGPTEPCLAPLGPYTDTGPSPSPSWHALPAPPAGCPAYPFSDAGGPQPIASGESPAPAVGNTVEYMWNASEHQGDPFAADLTVWVRRDDSSPSFEYHAIRYEYPSTQTPTPEPSASPTGTPSPGPSITPGSPPPSQQPHSPPPTHSPTPKPSPTPIGI
jgi:hypothetical protein